MKLFCSIVLIVCACLVSGGCMADQSLDARAVLNKLVAAQGGLPSRVERTAKVESYTDSTGERTVLSRQEYLYCVDGDKFACIYGSISDISGKNDLPEVDLAAFDYSVIDHRHKDVYDGGNYYSCFMCSDMAFANLHIYPGVSEANRFLAICQPSGPFGGVFVGDVVSFAEIAAKAEQVTMRPQREKIDGADCIVIQFDGDHGEYTIWVDPQRGYNMLHAEVVKSRKDIWYSEPLDTPHPEFEKLAENWFAPVPLPSTRGRASFTCILDGVVLEKIDDLWLPVRARYSYTQIYKDGRIITSSIEFDRKSVEFNPDIKATSLFDLDFEDGITTTLVREDAYVPMIWYDGKAEPDPNRAIQYIKTDKDEDADVDGEKEEDINAVTEDCF